MTLSRDEIEHIARLARLALSETELEQYRSQLSEILEHFARLQAVDTSSLSAAEGAPPSESGLRPDVPRPPLERQTLLRTAPQVVAAQFRVPPVLEE